jgi:hypothetical protein
MVQEVSFVAKIETEQGERTCKRVVGGDADKEE